MAAVGSEARPLRVVVVGAGPSGFYAAGALLGSEHEVSVDMIDRLPTPFGLVRGGVAPDHQKIKNVTRAYNKTAAHPKFRFMGNVKVGRDVSLTQLLEGYDQVVLAVGAESANSLGIDGEGLTGSHSATAFVGWYNGHPDHQGHDFDLEVSAAVVVGVGNVSMDVTRVLVRNRDELAKTDITDGAVTKLRSSQIDDVYLLGRRGAAQAAFSFAEIKEIAELDGVDLVVRPEDAALDAHSQAWLEAHGDKNAKKNVAFLQQIAGAPITAPKRVHVRLLTSPVSYGGADRVQEVTVGRNEIYIDDRGGPRPRDTGDRETLAAGLVLRAVGYRGIPLPEAPFDERRGIIPNDAGRVTATAGGLSVDRLYVVGWAKRGPTGLIGTNRADSNATVANMLADLPALEPASRAPVAGLDDRCVDWSGWQRLDRVELDRGEAKGKIRDKFTGIDAMMSELAE